MHNLYSKLHRPTNLQKAWRHVYSNARASDSDTTKKDLEEFSKNYERNLKLIAAELKSHTYKFSSGRGVPIKRPDKGPRPIVVIPIRDRVVQRSLLDVIQSVKPVKKLVSVPTSYGGIEGRQVRQAIEHVCRSVKEGKKFFIRSDIKDFFTRIPRLDVIAALRRILPDNSLDRILDDATKTELANFGALGQDAGLFPSYERGVAQGYCLSPLFGNILLNSFDLTLNSDKVVCLRYIDDFIILGSDNQSVRTAFQKARRILQRFGMDAYEPSANGGKAKEGHVSKGLDFLGCSIYEGFVHPNEKSQRKLKEKIRGLLNNSISRLKECKFPCDDEFSLLKTLEKVNNTLLGWGNQYSFCNSRQLFDGLDRTIDRYIENYLRDYKALETMLKEKHNPNELRNILGVHLVSQSHSDPILPMKEKKQKKTNPKYKTM